MIFKPESVGLILEGKKTQTRRPVKDNDLFYCQAIQEPEKPWVYDNPARPIRDVTMWNPPVLKKKSEVGRTYAVCPGRGKKQVARILLKGIRCLRLCDISAKDARAEGLEVIAPSSPGCVGVYRYGRDPAKGYDTMWQASSITEAYMEMVEAMYPKIKRTDLFWVLDFVLWK